jgi:hypothetical protein
VGTPSNDRGDGETDAHRPLDRRGINCHYPDPSQASPTSDHEVAPPSLTIPLNGLLDINSQVLGLLPHLGEPAITPSTYYFTNLHRWVPFLSPITFHRQLVTFPSSNSDPDFGLLLLSVVLLGRRKPVPAGALSQDGLYLAIKGFVAQSQAINKPSQSLISALLLLSFFEYARREGDRAFGTLSQAIRLGYALGLDKEDDGDGRDTVDKEDERTESNNLWWGMVICER